MTEIKSPEDCQSKEDVRAEIDRLDKTLLDTLAERWTYVDRMWHFKESVNEVVVPWRIDQIISKVRGRAEAHNMPPDLAEAIWREIIRTSIEYEEEKIIDRDGG